MRVDRERTGVGGKQRLTGVIVRPLRTIAGCNAELMLLVAVADGVIEVEFAVCLRDRGSPEVASQPRLGANQCVAGKTPLEKIRGLKNGKEFTEGFAAGLEFACPN